MTLLQLTEDEQNKLYDGVVFRATYFRLLASGTTGQPLYEWLEERMVAKFGHRKYTGWKSFHNSYRSYLNSIKKGTSRNL